MQGLVYCRQTRLIAWVLMPWHLRLPGHQQLCYFFTHWGRVTHICVGNLAIIGSDNGLSPRRRQAIIWTNTGVLLIGPLGTIFSEIQIEILTFSIKKRHLKMSAKWWPFCLGLNVLICNTGCYLFSTRGKDSIPLCHFQYGEMVLIANTFTHSLKKSARKGLKWDHFQVFHNRMAWQWAETLVEIRVTLADIRGTTK